MKRSIFIFLWFGLCALQIYPQGAAETSQKIRSSIESRDYQTVLTALEALEKSDKKTYEANNYDYLSARMLEKTGSSAAAAAKYQSVVSRNSIFKQYALRHLSQIARSSGNLLLERTFLQEILAYAPDSLFADAVNARMARSFLEGGNYDSAIQLLNAQLSNTNAPNVGAANNKTFNYEKTPRFRENLALIAEAQFRSGKTNEAREAFARLLNNLPNPAQPDDYALTAVKNLDLMDGGQENFGKTAPVLPDAEHLRRALVYQFNRDFADARLHFQAIVQDYPASANAADAMFQIGRGLVQQTNYAEAIVWFERVQEQFPDSPSAKDALAQTASAYSRVNKPKEAVSRYQKYLAKYPDADNLERNYLNIVQIERDLGEDGDALKWTMKTQEDFRGKIGEALALFEQIKIRITQNDWQTAVAEADKLLLLPDLGGTRVTGGTNQAEVTFIKGYALEQLQRYAEAIDVYLSIPDGRNEYYGWRATERLRLLWNDERIKPIIENKIANFNVSAKIPTPDENRLKFQSIYRLLANSATLENIKKSYAELPAYKQIPTFKLLEFGRREVLRDKRQMPVNHQTLADELLFLNLYDEAAPELEAALIENGKRKTENGGNNSDLAYTLAVFYERGEMANRAVAFAEPLWKTVPADYQIELMPRQQVELLYPAPYADSLVKYAPERGVDPRFLLSIMRQESRYRADVKSYAAARGLMQFISSSALKTAGQLKLENFKQDDLYNPPTAILFGSQYLSDLFALFPNQSAAVAASYNGGEDNMKRWFVRAKSDQPDRYVPEIVFSQSKDYVYKVMANYRVYQIFYDEKLKAK